MNLFSVHKEFNRRSEEVIEFIQKCEYRISNSEELSDQTRSDIVYFLEKLILLYNDCVKYSLPNDAAKVAIQIIILDSILTFNELMNINCKETFLEKTRLDLWSADSKLKRICYNHVYNEINKVLTNHD